VCCECLRQGANQVHTGFKTINPITRLRIRLKICAWIRWVPCQTTVVFSTHNLFHLRMCLFISRCCPYPLHHLVGHHLVTALSKHGCCTRLSHSSFSAICF
jgi:hypothetical protein